MLKTKSTPERLTLIRTPIAETAIAIAATIVFGALAAVFFAGGNDAGVIFLVFAISGPVYLYFFVEIREAVFERDAASVTLRSRSLRGAHATAHSLAGLARAEVHRATPARENRSVDAELAAPPHGNFRAVLVYEDGSELPLTEGYSSGGGAFAEAQAVNRWLGDT